MKLSLTFSLLTLCLLGAVLAEPQQTSASSPATPAPTTPHHADIGSEMEMDPIYQEYMKKARELYIKALTAYYHAHPSRLESDLSHLTSMEYESMVPGELLDIFHLNKEEIEKQIKANDEQMINDEETDETNDETEMTTSAVEETDDTNQMETQQFGRFGRGRFGFGRGFGFGRFGFGRFGYGYRYPFYGGYYGGYGYPYYGGYHGGYGYPYWRGGYGWGFGRGFYGGRGFFGGRRGFI